LGKLYVDIDDELELKFRVELAKRGGKRGDLSLAIAEAIHLWLKANGKGDE